MKTSIELILCTLLVPQLLFSEDMLTPAYYTGKLKQETDLFLAACHSIQLTHPLQNKTGGIPDYRAPGWGSFGAGKGPGGTSQHHPATDLCIGNHETDVTLYAAHDGVVATYRDAPKYRHYISITKRITDTEGKELGKLVTLYAHVDLDLDEADGLNLNGKAVKQGDLISKNLFSDTRGGPHLHFEIRYYRPSDSGTEEFYGFRESVPGADNWPYGFWNPDIGYGYGHPESHGLQL